MGSVVSSKLYAGEAAGMQKFEEGETLQNPVEANTNADTSAVGAAAMDADPEPAPAGTAALDAVHAE